MLRGISLSSPPASATSRIASSRPARTSSREQAAAARGHASPASAPAADPTAPLAPPVPASASTVGPRPRLLTPMDRSVSVSRPALSPLDSPLVSAASTLASAAAALVQDEEMYFPSLDTPRETDVQPADLQGDASPQRGEALCAPQTHGGTSPKQALRAASSRPVVTGAADHSAPAPPITGRAAHAPPPPAWLPSSILVELPPADAMPPKSPSSSPPAPLGAARSPGLIPPSVDQTPLTSLRRRACSQVSKSTSSLTSDAPELLELKPSPRARHSMRASVEGANAAGSGGARGGAGLGVKPLVAPRSPSSSARMAAPVRGAIGEAPLTPRPCPPPIDLSSDGGAEHAHTLELMDLLGAIGEARSNAELHGALCAHARGALGCDGVRLLLPAGSGWRVAALPSGMSRAEFAAAAGPLMQAQPTASGAAMAHGDVLFAPSWRGDGPSRARGAARARGGPPEHAAYAACPLRPAPLEGAAAAVRALLELSWPALPPEEEHAADGGAPAAGRSPAEAGAIPAAAAGATAARRVDETLRVARAVRGRLEGIALEAVAAASRSSRRAVADELDWSDALPELAYNAASAVSAGLGGSGEASRDGALAALAQAAACLPGCTRCELGEMTPAHAHARASTVDAVARAAAHGATVCVVGSWALGSEARRVQTSAEAGRPVHAPAVLPLSSLPGPTVRAIGQAVRVASRAHAEGGAAARPAGGAPGGSASSTAPPDSGIVVSAVLLSRTARSPLALAQLHFDVSSVSAAPPQRAAAGARKARARARRRRVCARARPEWLTARAAAPPGPAGLPRLRARECRRRAEILASSAATLMRARAHARSAVRARMRWLRAFDVVRTRTETARCARARRVRGSAPRAVRALTSRRRGGARRPARARAGWRRGSSRRRRRRARSRRRTGARGCCWRAAPHWPRRRASSQSRRARTRPPSAAPPA